MATPDQASIGALPMLPLSRDLAEEERNKAARFVASQATDPDDARDLLMCLGLIPDPHSKGVL